jgi:predicted anti-sigma-YlaC factor YlaD
MLSCKQVAQVASDYLEQDANAKFKWQVRLHLMMCSNCRRFVRHLKITQTVSTKIARNQPLSDPKPIWEKVQQRIGEDTHKKADK